MNIPLLFVLGPDNPVIDTPWFGYAIPFLSTLAGQKKIFAHCHFCRSQCAGGLADPGETLHPKDSWFGIPHGPSTQWAKTPSSASR